MHGVPLVKPRVDGCELVTTDHGTEMCCILELGARMAPVGVCCHKFESTSDLKINTQSIYWEEEGGKMIANAREVQFLKIKVSSQHVLVY